jgi:hypothetical protein
MSHANWFCSGPLSIAVTAGRLMLPTLLSSLNGVLGIEESTMCR